MTDRAVSEFAGHYFDFDVELESLVWTIVDPQSADLLEGADFPLVAWSKSTRYELNSDGTSTRLDSQGALPEA